MMTKFNKELYAKIKTKKNEPLSNISQWRLRVVEKEVVKKGSSTPALDKGCAASPGVSIEEVIPRAKKCNTEDKGKGKIEASVWADARMDLAKANVVVTLEELKEILGVPSHEMVSRHVHKLVQVTLSISSFFCP